MSDRASNQGRYVVALAGAIGSGKSTIARAVADATNYALVRSRLYIEAFLVSADIPITETNLQNAGKFLVQTIGGLGLTRRVLASTSEQFLVYDSFRNAEEAAGLKRELGASFQLVFLDVPEEERRRRFLERKDRSNTERDFASRMQHAVEDEVLKLKPIADLVIDSGEIEDVVRTIRMHLDAVWSVS